MIYCDDILLSILKYLIHCTNFPLLLHFKYLYKSFSTFI